MDEPPKTPPEPLDIEPWEQALVRQAAARIRTTDREELEAELRVHLFRVKRRHKRRARDWRAFLARVLHNKARNWIRDRQHDDRYVTPLTRPEASESEERLIRRHVIYPLGLSLDDRLALAAVREELDPELKRVWDLVQEGLSQVEIARRLSVHRNTVGAAIRKIQEELKRHGF
jgi:RNA polymerase sigma factor (sigma-70 family)